MITETEIITAISGSIMGDYPAVLQQSEARKIAVDLFKKILDIDNNGAINSILFYAPINANPSALALTQRTKIETATANLNGLIQSFDVVGSKIKYIVNPDLAVLDGIVLDDETRANLIGHRQRLQEILKTSQNIPTILSTLLT